MKKILKAMKARIRKTGGIAEIKGKEHHREPLKLCWDFEVIPDIKEDNSSTIDWNQVRIQASIGAMQVILSNNNNCYPYKEIAIEAVGHADALVKELRK